MGKLFGLFRKFGISFDFENLGRFYDVFSRIKMENYKMSIEEFWNQLRGHSLSTKMGKLRG